MNVIAKFDVVDADVMRRSAQAAGLKFEVIEERGPGGGNPHVSVVGPCESTMAWLHREGFEGWEFTELHVID